MTPGTTERRRSDPLGVAIGALIILAVGLAYRATFITQGFNATDEGWLQSVARRIVDGQVAYRDFNFDFPPFSIYKEAAIQWLFGSGYDILVSRWAFVVEATIGSVLAFLVLRLYLSTRVAFALAVPTVFFSVLNYVFANYTYDGQVLDLLAVLLLLIASRGKPRLAVLAGCAACLATLAKPTYLAFLVLAMVAGPQEARRLWGWFLGGFAAVFVVVASVFALDGAAGQYLYQSFIFYSQANPLGVGFAIWQNLPTAFARRELEVFALVAILLAAATVARPDWLRLVCAAGVPTVLIYYLARHRMPDEFAPMAMGVLLVINSVALVVTVAARTRTGRRLPALADLGERLPPPELPAFALGLQYLAQYTSSGILYSYLGAYLSAPVALIFVWRLAGQFPRLPALPAFVPVGVGLWLVLGSILFVQNYVYFDEPRANLTATFATPELSGIMSNPANVMRVDGVVADVDRYTRPEDPILALPDFACIYLLTDRRNPTHQDWYESIVLTPAIVSQALADIERDPPRLVVVETRYEQDYSRSRPDQVIDYQHTEATPIYDYVFAHYHDIASVDDIRILLPDS